MRRLLGEPVRTDDHILRVRAVAPNAKSRSAPPDLLALPAVAGHHQSGKVPSWNARQGGLEDAGDVFHVAGIDGGGVQLDQRLSHLEIWHWQFLNREDRRRPVFFEAEGFHGRHLRSPCNVPCSFTLRVREASAAKQSRGTLWK